MISAFAGMSFWRTFDSTCVLYLCRRNCAQGELEKTREFSTHLSLFCHWRADKMLFVRLYNIDSTTSVFSFHLYHVRNDCSALSFLHIECFFPSTSLWSFVNRNSVQYAYWFSSTNICCQLLPHPVVWMSTNSSTVTVIMSDVPGWSLCAVIQVINIRQKLESLLSMLPAAARQWLDPLFPFLFWPFVLMRTTCPANKSGQQHSLA